MILVVDATSTPTEYGGKPCKTPHLCESCGDVYLYDDRHECSECEERGILAEREALEEEWPDIPVLQPITLQVRKFSPEVLAEFGITEEA